VVSRPFDLRGLSGALHYAELSVGREKRRLLNVAEGGRYRVRFGGTLLVCHPLPVRKVGKSSQPSGKICHGFGGLSKHRRTNMSRRAWSCARGFTHGSEAPQEVCRTAYARFRYRNKGISRWCAVCAITYEQLCSGSRSRDQHGRSLFRETASHGPKESRKPNELPALPPIDRRRWSLRTLRSARARLVTGKQLRRAKRGKYGLHG
jgi:hypothetical protein